VHTYIIGPRGFQNPESEVSFYPECRFPFTGQAEICAPVYSLAKTGMVRIGFGNVGIFDYNFSRTIWENNGCVVFRGGANVCQGCKVSVGKSGVLTFGKNFTCTAESQFVCVDKITFGDDCLISWENLIMDTDWHQVLSSKNKANHAPINIGNHVWVGCRCTILKGVDIPDNSIIAAGSIVTKRFFNTNSLIAGNDARLVAMDIDWQP